MQFKRRPEQTVDAVQYDGSIIHALEFSKTTDGRIWPEYRCERFTGRLCVLILGGGLTFANPWDYIVTDRIGGYFVMPCQLFEALYERA